MRHYCALVLALCWGGTLCSFAQGDANLLLQYNRGPTFESLYHPWNVKIHLLGVRINASLDDTRPSLTWGAGMLLQHKLNKTLGLTFGATYLNIHYRYQKENLDSKDFLAFWRLPILIQLTPETRVNFELGPTYNLISHTYNSEIVRTGIEIRPPYRFTTDYYSYAPGHFKNGFGVLAAVSYRFWKSFSARLEYTLIKRQSDPFIDQSNTFRGMTLGLQWALINPSKPKKNDKR